MVYPLSARQGLSVLMGSDLSCSNMRHTISQIVKDIK